MAVRSVKGKRIAVFFVGRSERGKRYISSPFVAIHPILCYNYVIWYMNITSDEKKSGTAGPYARQTVRRGGTDRKRRGSLREGQRMTKNYRNALLAAALAGLLLSGCGRVDSPQ